MTGLDLLVAAHNAPPAIGGIERLVEGLCRHVAPGGAHLLRVAPGRLPPRWRSARRALASAPPSRATVCAEWWPEARAIAATGRRGTRAVFLYGTEVARALDDRRARRSLAVALAAVDVPVAISAYTAALVAELGVRAPVVPPGVDLDPPAADAARVSTALGLDGRTVVLTVARLVPRKGHDRLMARWLDIVAAVPDAVWVVVGDGPERASLAAAAPPSVRLVGSVDDPTVEALRRIAAVHVMPGVAVGREVEGFGMAAVEAGAAGTPTVATDVGGVTEAVGPGGVVVAAGDHDALAAAVVRLLTDDADRRRLGSAARQHAESLAWPRFGERMRALLGLGELP